MQSDMSNGEGRQLRAAKRIERWARGVRKTTDEEFCLGVCGLYFAFARREIFRDFKRGWKQRQKLSANLNELKQEMFDNLMGKIEATQ